MDHIKLDIYNGKRGPWIHLYCPFNTECNGKDPIDIFSTQFDVVKEEWEPYEGPLPDSEEYKTEVVAFTGTLGESPDE